MNFREQFVSSPETFMVANIVRPQFFDGGAPPKETAVVDVTIKEQAGKRCSKAGGKVYHLSLKVEGVPAKERLKIFWLVYKHNDFTLGTLTNAASYMFTALMNGCSLGFGSQSGDGACMVSHANKASAGVGGEVAQRDAQRDQLRTAVGSGHVNVIEPVAYRATSHGGNTFSATNFGKNVNGVWTFYTHKFMDSGGTGGVILHGGTKAAVSVPL